MPALLFKRHTAFTAQLTQATALLLPALFVIGVDSTFFVWAKNMQLRLVGASLPAQYPPYLYVLSVALGVLAGLAVWFMLLVALTWCCDPSRIPRLRWMTAAAHLSLLLAPGAQQYHDSLRVLGLPPMHPIGLALWCFIFSNCIAFLFCFSSNKLKAHGSDFFVAAIFLIILLLFIPHISPFSTSFPGWTQDLERFSGNSFQLFYNSSFYSIIPWIDQSEAYGGMPVNVFAHYSWLLGIVSYLSNTIVSDFSARLLTYKYVFLVDTWIGLFGYYVFFNYGLRLQDRTSFLGALLVYFSNQYFIYQIESVGAGYHASFFILPYTLLFYTIACRSRERVVYAFLAGFLYSATMYVTRPHLDLFKTAFEWVALPYIVWCTIFICKRRVAARLILPCLTGIGFLAGCALWLLPLLDATLSHEILLSGYTTELLQKHDLGTVKRIYGALWDHDVLTTLKILLFQDFQAPRQYVLGTHQNLLRVCFIGLFVPVLLFCLHKLRSLFREYETLLGFWIVYTVFVLYVLIAGETSVPSLIMEALQHDNIRAFYRFSTLVMLGVATTTTIVIDYCSQKSKYRSFLPYFIAFMCLWGLVLGIDTLVNATDPAIAATLSFPSIIAAVSFCVGLSLLSRYKHPLLLYLSFGVCLGFFAYFDQDMLHPQPTGRYTFTAAFLATAHELSHDPRTQAFALKRIARVRAVAPAHGAQGMRFLQELAQLPGDGLYDILPFLQRHAAQIDRMLIPSDYDPYVSRLFNHALADRATIWHGANALGVYFAPPSKEVAFARAGDIDLVNWNCGHGMFFPANRVEIFARNASSLDFLHASPFPLNKELTLLYAISGTDYVIIPRHNAREEHFFLTQGFHKVSMRPLWSGYTLFANPFSYHRAYFADRVVPLPSLDLDRMPGGFSPRFQNAIAEARRRLSATHLPLSSPPHPVALLETAGPPPVLSGKSVIDAMRIRANKALFTVTTTGQALFVYNACWLKDWRCWIDGRPAPISHVNIAFMGVAVPPGKHTIFFEYVAKAKMTGFAILCLTAIVLFAVLHVQAAKQGKNTHASK